MKKMVSFLLIADLEAPTTEILDNLVKRIPRDTILGIAGHAPEGAYSVTKMSMAENRAGTCTWTVVDPWEGDTWKSSCGQEWCFNEGSPKENQMNFCHSCGRSLVEEYPDPRMEGED